MSKLFSHKYTVLTLGSFTKQSSEEVKLEDSGVVLTIGDEVYDTKSDITYKLIGFKDDGRLQYEFIDTGELGNSMLDVWDDNLSDGTYEVST